MANPGMAYFPLTNDRLVDGITHGYYWDLDSSRTVNYSISNGFNREFWNSPSQVIRYLGEALGTFSNYANIRFSYSGFYDNPLIAQRNGSEINLSMDAGSLFSSPRIWALGFFPNPENNQIYTGASGDIFINVNSQANSLPSYSPGSQGWFLLLHELGHTLGLKHPHDDGGTQRPTFDQLGISWLDKDWATIMSYEDDNNPYFILYDPATPMILDVLALQYIYGKNNATNTGNTTYSLTETNFYYTLWDASGQDTLDAGLAKSGWSIYLPRQALSGLIDTKVGYASPTNASLNNSPTTFVWLAGDYENANGTQYRDHIEGNALANQINGNGGNDFMMGYEGDDTFDWDINSRAGNDTMHGGLGDDVYVVDSLGDSIVELANEGQDTIWAPFSYSIASVANVENLYLFGSERSSATGNSLNNQLMGNVGNNRLDGGAGIDTAVYSGTAASYTLILDTSSSTIMDRTANRDGTDTLVGVERLKFSDINIALDVQAGENAGMAYRMYKAALNRAPDLEGLGDWIGVLDNGANIFTDLARGFTESTEFKTRYGPNLSNEAFVTLLYNNVLGRDPDQGGLNAWVGAIEQRGATREVVLHGFSESPENIRYSLNLIGQGMLYIE